MLCTLARPTSGTARVSGFDVVAERDDVRRHIGLVFQDQTLDGYLTAEQNLRLHAELYGIDAGVVPARMRQMLEMVDLWDRRDQPVQTYSGGMRRRLEIARGLMHSPRVLFLDEPTIGLDPQTRSSIWRYIRALQEAEGTTIFMTTHYMDEAEFCDRIAIMDRGEIVVLDTPEALKASVGADRVVLGTADDDAALAALRDRFDIEATVAEGAVTFHVASGEAFVPRLFAELGVGITSVAVSRPTLDDVFMRYTGSTIRDAETTGTSRPQPRDDARAVGGGPMSAAIADVVAVRVPERSWRSEVRAVRIVWRRDLIRFANDRMRIVTLLIQPLLFLFVLGSGLQSLSAASTDGVDLTTFIFPGILCMALVFSAMFSAISLVMDREFGFLREMMVAPVRRSSIVVGKCLGGATIAALQGVIVLALAGLVDVPYDPVLLARPLRPAAADRLHGHRLRRDGRHPHQADPDVHERDADARDADVLPVRRAVPRLGPAHLAGGAQPPQPADLRRRPDAAAGVQPPRHLRGRPAHARPRRHLVRLARALARRGGDRAGAGPGDDGGRHLPVLADRVTAAIREAADTYDHRLAVPAAVKTPGGR